MTEKTEASLYALTSPAMLIFENLFTARAVGPKGKAVGTPKYDVSLGLTPDHPDLKSIQALMLGVARAKWPGRDIVNEARDKDANGNPKQPMFKFPLASGDKLADKAKAKGKDGEAQRGKLVIASRSKFEPILSAVVNGSIVEFISPQLRPTAKQYFYRGVEVLVELNFVAYDGVDTNPDGVTAYLNKVCSLNTGDKLGGAGSNSAEVFKGYVGLHSNENPLAGVSDEEIPF